MTTSPTKRLLQTNFFDSRDIPSYLAHLLMKQTWTSTALQRTCVFLALQTNKPTNKKSVLDQDLTLEISPLSRNYRGRLLKERLYCLL